MSKHIKMRFSKARRDAEHLDSSVNLANVEAHGYEPRYMPPRYLTVGRWYYITGALYVRGERRIIGVPAQLVSFEDYGLHFVVTQAALDSLDILGTPEDNRLILGNDDFCHVFKFKQRPAIDPVEEAKAVNGLELALFILDHANKAVDAAREGVAAATTNLNKVRGY